ncbi:unnamed protein product, partial [Meganyctiphanes norvegica]
ASLFTINKKEELFSVFFCHPSQQSNDGLHASYNIAMLMEKSGNPHNIAEELLLPVVIEVLKTVLHHESPEQIIKAILLSINTVQIRMDKMAGNIEETLCNKLKTTTFSLQIDESTLTNNASLLLGYVR